MKKIMFILMVLVALFVAAPAAAQEDASGGADWGMLAAGFAIAIA